VLFLQAENINSALSKNGIIYITYSCTWKDNSLTAKYEVFPDNPPKSLSQVIASLSFYYIEIFFYKFFQVSALEVRSFEF